jgi:hypothetical protein
MEMYQKFYLENPYFCKKLENEIIIEPPPVERLYVVYGVNVETEVMFFFKQRKNKLILGIFPFFKNTYKTRIQPRHSFRRLQNQQRSCL